MAARNMHYSFRKIDSYNLPIRMVMSRRGLGKTFGGVIKGLEAVAEEGKRFIYVVETKEMLKELCQNKGEKFFAGIVEFLESDATNKRQKRLYKHMFANGEGSEVEEGDVFNNIKGGTIRVGGITAGYIVAFRDFSAIKRNNFVGLKYVIIDEFISEEIDIRSLQNPKRIASIIQSICRKQEVIIYLFANSIRSNDILLERLGFTNMEPGEFRVIKDKFGALGVGHYVSIEEYPEFDKTVEKTVANRLAALLGEDSLEKNEFRDKIDRGLMIPDKPAQNRFVCCLEGESESVRVHVAKDGKYYVMEDYGVNKRNRFCVDIKNVRTGVYYNPEYRDMFIKLMETDKLRFDTSISYLRLRAILKLEQK